MNIMLKGGFFIWPIMLCSLVSLTVIFERLFYFYRTRMRSRNLTERVQALLESRKGDEGRYAKVS